MHGHFRLVTSMIGVALLLCAACTAAPQQPRWPQAEALPASASQAAPDPVELHPDYAAMKPWHHYSQVSRVTPYRHHFTAWYSDIEPVVVELVATRDEEGRVTLATDGGYWGGMAVAPDRDDVPPIPEELADIAALIVEELAATGHGSDVIVAYRGAYGEVEVTEIIPTAQPEHSADGKARGELVGWSASTTFEVDSAGTKVTGVSGRQSGFGLFCYRLQGCSEPAYWLEQTPQAPHGYPLLRLEGGWETLPEGYRQEILATRREVIAGSAPTPLAPAALGEGLLAPDFAQTLGMGLTIYARDYDDPQGQLSGAVSLRIDTAKALRDGAHEEVDLDVAGVRFTAVVDVTPVEPPELAFVGQRDVRATLVVKVSGRGTSHEVTVPLEGVAVFDEGRAATVGLKAIDDPRPPDGRGHPFRFQFEGVNHFEIFDVYPSLSLEMSVPSGP